MVVGIWTKFQLSGDFLGFMDFWLILPEPYSELCQTSKAERFTEIVNSFYLFTILAKRSILDIWQGS